MADIDVVPKHRNYVWLWIVLAIIVIALLIWAFRGTGAQTTGSRVTGSGGAIAHLVSSDALQRVG
jgi:hypothetical protein